VPIAPATETEPKLAIAAKKMPQATVVEPTPALGTHISKAELIKIATSKGVIVKSKMTKQQIIAAIEATSATETAVSKTPVKCSKRGGKKTKL
jgi:hypothetical protein